MPLLEAASPPTLSALIEGLERRAGAAQLTITRAGPFDWQVFLTRDEERIRHVRCANGDDVQLAIIHTGQNDWQVFLFRNHAQLRHVRYASGRGDTLADAFQDVLAKTD